MYVLDENGNLLSAAEVQKILEDSYASEKEDLFTNYGVVGDGPTTSVRSPSSINVTIVTVELSFHSSIFFCLAFHESCQFSLRDLI